MRRDVELPHVFETIAQLEYVQKKNDTEYCAACPSCGGSVHPGGEWPDRFVLLLESRTTGGPFAFCRHCGFKWWPGKGEGEDITPEQREAWRREAAERQEAERLAAERRAKNLHQMLERDRIWERWYENLLDNPGMARVWESRGIDLTWASVWSLGYNPDFVVWRGEKHGEFRTPALTIPVFIPSATVPHNINNRLLVEPKPGDKCRTLFSKIIPYPWMAAPELGWEGADTVFIAEGEIKAMNVYRTLEDPRLQVIGLQGKNGFEAVAGRLKGQAPFICLDPDAEAQAVEYARRLGGARVIYLPEKIDDLILAGALDKRSILHLMHTARFVR